MRFLKFSFSFLIAGLVFLSACQPEEPGSQNIAELAKDTDALSSLVEALELTGLTNAFEGTAAQTVFAPDNDAFQNLLDSNPAWNELSDIDVATLTKVLLFHVVEGSVRAGDLSDTYVNTLAKGPNDEALSLQIAVTGGVKFNGSTTPIDTDIEAVNGVVHIVNEVMLPPNVVNIASNNGDFSILVQALTRADLTTDYVSVLTGDGPFTVFAPTDTAFAALLESNAEWSELSDIPVATLEAVLNYHVVNAANVQSNELSDDQEITMLGGTTTVDLSSGANLETTSGQTVSIVLTDVQGINGVVHEVLLP